jgi:hypothetical protein
MRLTFPAALLTAFFWLLCIPSAEAGMPGISLSDVGALRIQNISFFLVLFLGSAWLIKIIWNRLSVDWDWLPRLTYFKALGLMMLWGLLFVLVLTMISGARELMTPGAWEKQGLTYRLKDTAPQKTESPLGEQREKKLHQLRVELWKYAAHDGQFPPFHKTSDIPADAWEIPHASGMQYIYASGLTTKGEKRLLAWEPDLFGSQRYVLFTNGDLLLLDTKEVTRLLKEEKK